MGFIGAINQQLRKFFGTHAKILEGRKIYVGCSGNFSIESVISSRCARADIHSNDISLYSTAAGYMLTDRHLPVEIIHPDLTWLNDYTRRGPCEQIAVLQLLLTMLEFEKRNNAHRQRLWDGYLAQFDYLFSRTVEKARAFKASVRIVDYTTTDVFDYFPRSDGVMIGYLPTYSGGYERLYKKLSAAVRWESPDYAILTEERRLATIEKMTKGEYILFDDTERDLPCISKVAKPGKREVYIYSNLRIPGGLIRSHISEKHPRYDILMPDDEITTAATITVKQVDLPTINHYRNLFLSKRITPGAGGPNYLVFAAGKLFGAMMFLPYSVKLRSRTEIYLMSDFVVPSNRHTRLAKLMLMVTLCRETRELLEKNQIKRYETILTSVFTDKPVSMKYRGLYELVKRGEGFLNYRGTFADLTYLEVIPQWIKKYCKQEKRQNA
jgi:hypothetical protein